MKFRSEPGSITGSMAAVFTPFTSDGVVDLDGLRRLIRWQLKNGSDGISIGGSTGEPSALTIAERAQTIQVAAEETSDAVPFLPGTGSAKLDETIELTGHAAEAGADAALVITPYYAKPTQEALYQWYKTVAEEYPDLPIVAYNVPGRTSVEIAPDTVGRLFRDVENFVGVKETTKDFEHFSRVLYECGPELMVWSGIELLSLPILALGGAGFVSALTNIAPAAVSAMYHAYSSGDFEKARRIHYGLHPLVDLLFTETNPAPSKWLMKERGLLESDYVRPPLIPLTESGKAKARKLADAGSDYLTQVN